MNLLAIVLIDFHRSLHIGYGKTKTGKEECAFEGSVISDVVHFLTSILR